MAIVALIVAAIAALVLVAPVRLDVELAVAPEAPRPSVRVRVNWLFVSWRSGSTRPDRPARVQPPPARRPAGGGSSSRRVLAAIRTPGFLARTRRFVLDLLRALAPRRVDGWLRFGFDDPMVTGACVGAAQAASGTASAWRIRMEPDFTGACLAGHVRAVWAVRPVAVLWPIGAMCASPTTWRAAVAAFRAG